MYTAVALLALVGTAFGAVPMLHQDAEEKIAHEFIVKFHDDISNTRVQEHMAELQRRLARSHTDSKVMFQYRHTIKGYAIHDTVGDVVTYLQTLDADIAHIEPNQVARASMVTPPEEPSLKDDKRQCVIQEEATWGIVRTGQRALNIDGRFAHREDWGMGVKAYIMDTGIRYTHVEFGGFDDSRAIFGYDATASDDGFDRNGHGTHVAGSVGATLYGIAKGVTLVSVKVLGDNGSGSFAGVIAGIDWSAGDSDGADTSNMSLGGGLSTAVNDAVNAAVLNGLTVIVASGNSNTNACNSSPASAEDAYSVNSITNTDARSTFSNFGPCTQIFAPGSAITAPWHTSDVALNTISGTSMAAPHVCGVAAVLHQSFPDLSPAAIYAMLTETGTPDVVTNPGANTPNILAYVPCEDATNARYRCVADQCVIAEFGVGKKMCDGFCGSNAH